MDRKSGQKRGRVNAYPSSSDEAEASDQDHRGSRSAEHRKQAKDHAVRMAILIKDKKEALHRRSKKPRVIETDSDTEEIEEEVADPASRLARHQREAAKAHIRRMAILIKDKKEAHRRTSKKMTGSKSEKPRDIETDSDTEEEVADPLSIWRVHQPPRSSSVKLRVMLEGVYALPTSELPWVGEMVCRAARLATIGREQPRAK